MNKKINEKLGKFIEANINDLFSGEETALEKAYNKLDEAIICSNKTTARKLAKEAYKISNECFDALIFIADLEPTITKKINKLKESIDIEKNRLKKDRIYIKDNFGLFYQILETRPYLDGLYKLAFLYANNYQITNAIKICKEILKLNANDNLGIRYLLMDLYALSENEKQLLNIYDKYKEKSLETLFPLLVLYYKLYDDKKTKKYYKEINKFNPYIIDYIDNYKKSNITDYYQKGSLEEAINYLNTYSFLIKTIPNIKELATK